VEVAPARVSLADGRFRLGRLLGEGGMGVVYEAYDRQLRQPVALKTMRSSSADAVLRFKGEFRAVQAVRHPNLVQLGELFVDGATWFFTMELVDGDDVLSHVWADVAVPAGALRSAASAATVLASIPARRRRGSTPIAAALGTPAPFPAVGSAGPPTPLLCDEARLRAAVQQIARGLDELHRAGVVHRDVKPSNVLVGADGRVVLLDFGLAVGPGDGAASGLLEGTIEYMAPEQAAGERADPAADLYAMGAVVYEAITRRPPFVGDPMQILRDKQGTDPVPPSLLFTGVPPDLDALCLALLDRDPACRPTAHDVAAALGAATPRRRPSTDKRTGQGPPFVGRAGELAALGSALDDSVRAPAVVLVRGDSGIGKSALLQRFADDSRERGAVVFGGRCHERESVPFRAFDGVADALVRHLLALPAADRAAIAPADLGELRHLFRVFDRVIDLAGDPPTDPGAASERSDGGRDVREQRRRGIAVLQRLLGNLAARAPVVLAIDDLQWADPDSLLLLDGVLGASPPPLLLVGTVRPDAGRGERDLRRALAGLGVDVRELVLGPLPEPDCAALSRLLGAPVTGDAADELARACQGSPLFLEQMVSALGAGKDRAASLELALAVGLADLDEPLREIVDLVSIADAALDQATVARVLRVPRYLFAERVDALRQLRLVRTSGIRRSDLIEPYHDQVARAARSRLEPERARRLHQRLAEALERRTTRAWLVCHHWLAAGDAQRAAAHAVRAAGTAHRETAARRAAELCRTALSLLPRGDGAVRPLQVALATALGNAGRGVEAALEWLVLADDTPGAAGLEARRRAAELLIRSGRVDDGIAVVRDVLSAIDVELPTTPRRAVAALLWRRAQVRLHAALPVRTLAPDPRAHLRIDTCLSLGLSLAMTDHIAGASLHALGAAEAMRLGDPGRIAAALATEASYHATIGARGAARSQAAIDRAVQLAAVAGSAEAHAMTMAARAVTAFLLGRFGDAVVACDAAARTYSETCPGHLWELASIELFAIWSLSYTGDLVELGRRQAALLRSARWHDDQYAATFAVLADGVFPALAADRPDDASAAIDAAMAAWSQRGFHIQHLSALMGRATIDLYRGAADAAHAALTAAWPTLERSLFLRVQQQRMWVLSLRARAALASGALDAAERDGHRLIGDAAWADGIGHLVLAGVAAARGRPTEARRRLERAIAGLERAGLALFVAAAQVRLHGLTGDELATANQGWTALIDRGVRRPERWVDLLAPWPAAPAGASIA
jgi:serine/threonine protein kinase